jgi:hypothetical protein
MQTIGHQGHMIAALYLGFTIAQGIRAIYKIRSLESHLTIRLALNGMGLLGILVRFSFYILKICPKQLEVLMVHYLGPKKSDGSLLRSQKIMQNN